MTNAVLDPQQLVRDAVRKVSAIATLPEVTARIIETVESPESSAAQLHKIVAHDPALVTRILKVVNSAFYGLPGQVGSIERAIVLLGLNAVKNIAVAASIGQLFRGIELCEGFTARDLWTHCISVAVASRALAVELKLPIAEEAFLAGMIHDVGLIVSLQTAPDALRDVCRRVMQGDEDFCTVERELTGVDHQMLGAGLTEHWKFPRSCQLVAGYHHRPAALSDDNRRLVAIVYIADTLCCELDGAFNLTACRQPLTDVAGDASLFNPPLLDRIRASLPELVAEASRMLG